MITLNENQIRLIVIQEYFSLLDEADIPGVRRIVRPGGATPSTISTGPIPERNADVPRPPITGISSVIAPAHIPIDSAWVAGSSAFNSIYNMGNAEELIRFKTKTKIPDESRLISHLVSHVFKPGTYFIIPELFNSGQYGVGRIIDIINHPVQGAPGETAPLAIAEFKPGQHRSHGQIAATAPIKVSRIGIAFLLKISMNDADEESANFRRVSAKPVLKQPTGGMKTVKYGAK